MDNGEPQIYGAIATTRAAEVQLRWARARVFLFMNALLLPLVVANTDLVARPAKLAICVIGVAVNILWFTAGVRGGYWVSYWNRKLADLERLDQGQPKGPRVLIFADPELTDAARGHYRWRSLHRQLLIVAAMAATGWVGTFVALWRATS